MHRRNRNGWGGIVENDDLDDAEVTDPSLELRPTFAEPGADEKTRIDYAPPDFEKRLTLPRPASDPSASPSSAVEFPVEVKQLVQSLEGEKVSDPKKVALKKKNDSIFTKEVVLTAIGGLLLLGAAFAYTRSGDEPSVVPVSVPATPPAPVPAPPPEKKAEAPLAPTIVPESAAEETRKTTTPLLSILSSPSGAKVEINGTIYGATPLIQPSPPNMRSLSIRLIKDNYKNFETVLTANDAGHFNLNAVLEKR